LAWPPIADGPYWSPNPSGSFASPRQATAQAPYQKFDIQMLEFRLVMTMPVWVESGTSGRFYCYFEHEVDGAIGFNQAPNTAFPAIAIIDGNGNAIPTGVNNGVTLNQVFADPNGTGSFFCQVQFGASLPPGAYAAKWTATYQPLPEGGNAMPTLPIEAIRYFTVTQTRQPSQFFLKQTGHL